MKILLLSLLIVLAFGQTFPPSSNPPSTDYFAPSNVRTLNLGEAVSSFVYNSTFQDHYQVFIPSWVKTIRYKLNNTDQTAFNYLEIKLSYQNYYGNYDSTQGFPCTESETPAACDDYDSYLYAYSGSSDDRELSAGRDFLPGTWQWVTAFLYYQGTAGISYDLIVEATSSCAQNEVVAVDSYDLNCVPSENIINVLASGATLFGTTSISSNAIYRIDVPKNTVRIYALLTSPEAYLYVLASGSYVSTSYYDAWTYQLSGTYNSNDGTYSYYLEIPQPPYGLPFYFTVVPYYTAFANFTVQFVWDSCGENFAGYGVNFVDYSVPSVSFSIPDCSDPVIANIDAYNYSPITFDLPAYNPDNDYYYSGAYAYLHVPVNTAGYRNFTCTASADNVLVIFNKDRTADCAKASDWNLYCDGPSTQYSDFVLFLSEDFYTGGDWSIGACNAYYQTVTATLYSSGQIYFEPSPSSTPVVPSSSVTPSSSTFPIASSTPSSTPSASASPDSDSSSDGPQPPAGVYFLFLVIGFLLGVIVGLILGIYLFNKVKARKEASMNYVPLQPYAMPWNAMPVQMPMYNPQN